jgi:hypothetical protein
MHAALPPGHDLIVSKEMLAVVARKKG